MAVSGAAPEIRPKPPVRSPSANQIVAICSLTGAFGVVSGYCVFLLWAEQSTKDEQWPFLIGLAIAAVASFAIEYLRDIIQHGEADRINPRRVLVTILTLMMFELFIVAWEDVAPRWQDVHAAGSMERFKGTLLGPLAVFMKQGHPILDIAVLGFLWIVGGIVLATTLGFAAASPAKMSLRAQMARGAARGLIAAMFTAPVGTVLYVLVVRVVLSLKLMIFDHDAWAGYLSFLSGDRNNNILLRICYTLFSKVYDFCGRSWWGPLLAIAIFIAAVWILAALRAAPVILLLVVAAAAVLLGQAWSDPGMLVRLYVLAAQTWIVPALFLGLTMPLMQRPAEMPREWGLVALIAAVFVLALTWGKFYNLGVLVFLVLLIAGVLIYRGMSVMDNWPVVALSTSILVYGTSLVFHHQNFISSFHYANSQAAYTPGPANDPSAALTGIDKKVVERNNHDLNAIYFDETPITPTPALRIGFVTLQGLEHHNLADPKSIYLNEIAITPTPALRMRPIALPDFGAAVKWEPTPTPTPERMSWFPATASAVLAIPTPLSTSPDTNLSEETERRLELALSTSVGFWTTVGLLAIWALRRKSSESKAAGAGL